MTGRRRPMRRLSDLLPELASQLGLDEELRLARGIASWERLVAELVPGAAGESSLLEIRAPTLIVAASDAIVGQELRLRSAELLEAFATAPGGTRLLDLRIVIRPGRPSAGPRPGDAGSRHGNG